MGHHLWQEGDIQKKGDLVGMKLEKRSILKAASSDALRAEVMVTRKSILRERRYSEMVTSGSNGELESQWRTRDRDHCRGAEGCILETPHRKRLRVGCRKIMAASES